MTPAALQSKSSTLGPRARGDELGLTAVAFSLFICFHLHLGFAFRPSEHLLAQAVHEVARARTQVSTDSTRTPCTCARTMSRVQQQCPLSFPIDWGNEKGTGGPVPFSIFAEPVLWRKFICFSGSPEPVGGLCSKIARCSDNRVSVPIIRISPAMAEYQEARRGDAGAAGEGRAVASVQHP